MEISQPTPELAVPDVVAAQEYYRDHLGFFIAWHDTAGRIGAVSHSDCAIFFRQTDGDIRGATLWIFTVDVDVAFAELTQLGAHITEPVRDTPWGMRQFDVRDPYGNMLYFHHGL